uniref:Ig-like domain-containing protein n=1 Tax=Rhabditophanes sp. KR3021 TaxID=114890 RepID=A0AC35TRB2_9BILA
MWQYRKSASAAWSNYGCEEGERFDYSCKNELGGDHESIGQCDISLKHTKNSGFYRCTDVNDNKFATDEFKVEVVGVDVVKVLNRNIRLNQDGYIQVLICSNPEPQILWHGRDQIIELGSSTERYSSMPLIKALKYPLNMQTPNHYADNCWYSTLVIKGITQADESINLFVTTKGFTTEKQITLTHFPKNRAFNRNQISFVLLLLSMNLIYFK